MLRHGKVFETYKRIHQSGKDSSEDAEKSKIARERGMAEKSERKAQKSARRLSLSIEDAGALEKYEEALRESGKARGNAKTHGGRLKELLKNKDFS